jgi:predicted Zn-ribbon and HTH transcriptional regulator
MAAFLPSVFPKATTLAIPAYDAAFEQRTNYPFTLTTIKPIDENYVPSAPTPRQRPTIHETPLFKPKTLAGIMVLKMDALAAMYSSEWMVEIEQEFRDKIRSFLSEDAVSRVLTKTRCRDCLYYFEKSSVKPSKTRVKSIGTFLSFWWNTSVTIGDVTYRWSKLPKAESNTETVVLSHLDNGDWIHVR